MTTNHGLILRKSKNRDILHIVRMYVIGWVFLSVMIPLLGYWT